MLLFAALGGLLELSRRAVTARRSPRLSDTASGWLPTTEFLGAETLTSWTTKGLTGDSGLEVRVDTGFRHGGPAWVDGAKFTDPDELSFQLGGEPRFEGQRASPQLTFRSGEWWEGYIVGLWRSEGSPGLTAGVFHYTDFMPERDGFGEALVRGGRVRINSLDWTPGEEVHCEFALLCATEAGRYYALRGSGAVTP